MTAGALALLTAIAAGPVADAARERSLAEVPPLVAALGSPRYADREAASRRLRALGELARPAAELAARTSPDPEVRERAAGVAEWAERGQYLLRRTLAADGKPLMALAVSPDGRELAVGGEGGSLHVFDLWTSRRVRSIDLGRPVYAVAYHPSGRRLAVAASTDKSKPRDGGLLAVVDPATGAVEPLPGATDEYLNVVYSPDGSRLLAVGQRRVEWWDVAARTRTRPDVRLTGWVWAAAIRPDGKRFAFGGQDMRVHVWDADAFAPVRDTANEPGDQFTFAAAYAPGGRRLAVGTFGGRLKVTDADTGAVLRSIDAHPAAVWRVAFSADGKRLVTSGHDGTVRVWDATTWERKWTFRPGDKRLYGVAFAPDRPAVLAVGDASRVYEWAVPR